MLEGVLDAAGMVEVVGSPATYAGRTAFRESIGNKMQEKAADWLREQGVAVPQTMKADGYDCLRSVFRNSHDNLSSGTSLEAMMEKSPQLRRALETGTPGLF